MTRNARFVLGVDLDGVCADFYGGMRKIAAEWLDKPFDQLSADVSYGLPEWGLPQGEKAKRSRRGYDALHRFAVTQRKLFEDLQPFPGAAQTLRELSDLDVRIRIITHRLFVENCHKTTVAQTVEWLDKWDFPYWDLCLVKDKTTVGADLYIEDGPSNIDQLRACGADVIVFDNSTNRDVEGERAKSWEEVKRLVLGRIEVWESHSGGGDGAVFARRTSRRRLYASARSVGRKRR